MAHDVLWIRIRLSVVDVASGDRGETIGRPTKLLLGAIALAVVSLVPARAAMQAEYVVWDNFAAVIAQGDIPRILGVVDAIERRNDGTFRVYGGKCVVDVRVVRTAPQSPTGQPLGGGSVISRVDVGAKQCQP